MCTKEHEPKFQVKIPKFDFLRFPTVLIENGSQEDRATVDFFRKALLHPKFIYGK